MAIRIAAVWLIVLLFALSPVRAAREDERSMSGAGARSAQGAEKSHVGEILARAEALRNEGAYWQARRLLKPLLREELAPSQRQRVDTAWIGARAWWYKFWISRATFVLCVFLVTFGMYLASRGRKFPIRRIPGLDAIKEAVGRATEMGRPSLFCIGVSNMDHPETFASMPILSYIAKVGAKLRNRLLIPICAERTITLQQLTYREACQSVGELRAYSPSDVRFFPGGQFYFAVTAMGYMLKERPAACFYFGYWEAESLMLSETGNVIGAMQIAGTSQLYQVPFFIAACDYVIIGEEFFAVSAKLSEDPILSGSLFGQDIVKILILVAVTAGTVAISFAAWSAPIRLWIDMIAH